MAKQLLFRTLSFNIILYNLGMINHPKMAFEPYLSERYMPCYTKPFKSLKPPIYALDQNCMCTLPIWGKGKSTYQKHYEFPNTKDHNKVDDCCKAPCPCIDKFPELPTNIYYCAKEKEECSPLDSCTTYKHFFVPHCVEKKCKKPPAPYDPCECPMEECTTTRADFTEKTPIPNGPAPAEIIKHGLWSTAQFCKDFTEETTSGCEYGVKCAEKRRPIKTESEIKICKCCPMRDDTTHRIEFRPKNGEDVCYPDWISNDEYYAHETNMESCTTYKHFYPPHPIPRKLETLKVESPNAIPFCTMNKLCYSNYDPEPYQKARVEMPDNDPWPRVKPTPFKYTDNLQTDPCAEFCDKTIYKSDFYPKTLCGRIESFKPITGHVPSPIPFNDNTTMKIAFPYYDATQYKDAVGNSGNPNGINWGPFVCPPKEDKCLPRFNSPYGNPLKPFLSESRCPCGSFDSRSSYNRDFIFRDAGILAQEEESICRELNVPRGDTLYRSSFLNKVSGKTKMVPPPISKGYRCIQPTSRQEMDTLYRLNYYDFWKNVEREKLELYRGQSQKENKNKAQQNCQNETMEDQNVDVETQIVFVPVRENKEEC